MQITFLLYLLPVWSQFEARITSPQSLAESTDPTNGQLIFFSNPPYNTKVKAKLKFYADPECQQITITDEEPEDIILIIAYESFIFQRLCHPIYVISSMQCSSKCKGLIFVRSNSQTENWYIDNTMYNDQEIFALVTSDQSWMSLFDIDEEMRVEVNLELPQQDKMQVHLVYSFGYYQEAYIKNVLHFLKKVKTENLDFFSVYPIISYDDCLDYDIQNCNPEDCFEETYCIFQMNNFHKIDQFFYFIAVVDCVKRLTKSEGTYEPFATFQLEIFDNCQNKFDIACIQAAVEYVGLTLQDVHSCINPQRALAEVNGQQITSENAIIKDYYDQLTILLQKASRIFIDSLIINYTTIASINPSISLDGILCENPLNSEALCVMNQDCIKGCTSDLLLNSNCDPECNFTECTFDLGNCRTCAPDCYESMIDNGTCDVECNNEACMFDGIDCCLCSLTTLTNDKCDQQCNNSQCNFDYGDCVECNEGCLFIEIGDGTCNQNCKNALCNFDESDCDCQCSQNLLDNNICNEECNNENCNQDEGDCVTCADGCFMYMKGDGVCQDQCNNVDCENDLGDCACLCQEALLGNNQCDSQCNNENCSNDGGDCMTCAQGCYLYMKGDKVCQVECKNDYCDNDLDDCVCACSQDLLDNGICDEQCNNINCDLDGGDCKTCAEGCYLYMLNDGTCQDQCNNADCDNDQGDCPSCGCPADKINNNFCNPECYNLSCNFDGGDCEICASGCYLYMLNDGICQSQCNVSSCQNDKGDCSICTCNTSQIGNNQCNPECNNQFCQFDGGDCKTCSQGCYLYMIDDGICQNACNNTNCQNDGQDCYCPCNENTLGNNICDEDCNILQCEYDKGDCNCPCSSKQLTNNFCDQSCNIKQCNYDNGECSQCSAGCFLYQKGDGICQSACNNENCGYDLGDCDCKCSQNQLGNGICEEECNIKVCLYDLGDCNTCLCDEALIGNKVCDIQCNSSLCEYDGGDCIQDDGENDDDSEEGLGNLAITIIIIVAASILQNLFRIIIIVLAIIIYKKLKHRRNSLQNQQLDEQNQLQLYTRYNTLVPVQKPENIDIKMQDFACSICLGSQVLIRIDATQNQRVTQCGHIFHVICLDEWVNSRRNANIISCPNCRAAMF